MNFPLLLPLIVTAALAVAGWYAVHRLSHEFAVSMAKEWRLWTHSSLISALNYVGS